MLLLVLSITGGVMRRKFSSAKEPAEPLRRRCSGVFALLTLVLVVLLWLIIFAVVEVELFRLSPAATGTVLAVVLAVTEGLKVPLLMLLLLLTLLLSLFEPDCRLLALIWVIYLLKLPCVVPMPSLVIPYDAKFSIELDKTNPFLVLLFGEGVNRGTKFCCVELLVALLLFALVVVAVAE